MSSFRIVRNIDLLRLKSLKLHHVTVPWYGGELLFHVIGLRPIPIPLGLHVRTWEEFVFVNGALMLPREGLPRHILLHSISVPRRLLA